MRKPSASLILSIIQNQNKTKTIPRTIFFRHLLTTILDARLKKFHCGLFKLLEILARAFFIKTHY